MDNVKDVLNRCQYIERPGDDCWANWTHMSAESELVCNNHGKPQNKRSVCIYIVRGGMVLGITRGWDPKNADNWALPGGKVEKSDKDDVEAAARELREETGYILDTSSAIPIFTMEAGPYLCTTYTGSADKRVYYDDREGRVEWIRPEQLLGRNCTFRDYNYHLLEKIGGLRHA